MPLYEYTCSHCKTRFELIRRLAEADQDAPCPACKTPARRVLSTFCSISKDATGMVTHASGGGCAGCSGGSCGSCGV